MENVPPPPSDLSVFIKSLSRESRGQRSEVGDGRVGSSAVFWVQSILSVSSSTVTFFFFVLLFYDDDDEHTRNHRPEAAGFTLTACLKTKKKTEVRGVLHTLKRHHGWEGLCHLWSSVDELVWFIDKSLFKKNKKNYKKKLIYTKKPEQWIISAWTSKTLFWQWMNKNQTVGLIIFENKPVLKWTS